MMDCITRAENWLLASCKLTTCQREHDPCGSDGGAGGGKVVQVTEAGCGRDLREAPERLPDRAGKAWVSNGSRLRSRTAAAAGPAMDSCNANIAASPRPSSNDAAAARSTTGW
jgi:hypothetical protein